MLQIHQKSHSCPDWAKLPTKRRKHHFAARTRMQQHHTCIAFLGQHTPTHLRAEWPSAHTRTLASYVYHTRTTSLISVPTETIPVSASPLPSYAYHHPLRVLPGFSYAYHTRMTRGMLWLRDRAPYRMRKPLGSPSICVWSCSIRVCPAAIPERQHDRFTYLLLSSPTCNNQPQNNINPITST